ncbi:hypothetical protein HG536_0C01920 [Torulaspora globosa]|uniref:Uncharacterized protein n=1 Tax=Torulaspora globosa TaxID=48254 RepID=A0A7G3ZET8_9SACH|nr:uncharacterized protein HG536_0C01920 [Torulaspora globosa]QLL32024.1 hypothetical protein HG536_0C01920 [Torulaspora globosa]
MVAERLSRLGRRNILFDDPVHDEEDEMLDDSLEEDAKTQFLFPTVGESYKGYTHSYMNMGLLERGEKDVLKFQESINGQVLQPIYELIRTNTLTPETLVSHSDKWSKENADFKYMSLKRRYYVDTKQVVRDRRKNDRIVCEPVCIFDLLMCAHLMNNHMSYRHLHQHLNEVYSNITREFAQLAVRYCSVCNQDQSLKPIEKYRHKNMFKGLLPLERVHLEIFEPFDGEVIANKYSHVLYCRDYHTRFIWLQPLKNASFKHLVSAISRFLLSMVRLPVYLESSTLDKQDLFDICEALCGKYGLKLGLGVNNSSQFHANGIRRIKKLLNEHKDDCLSDWNNCLKYGPYYLNRAHNTLAVGIPSDLLYSCHLKSSKAFSLKQEKVIDESSAENVVHIKKGLIYLESKDAQHTDEDESDVEEEDFSDCEQSVVPSDLAAWGHRRENSPTTVQDEPMGDLHPSSEISEPSTSFYDELISPSKKRLRLAPKVETA